MKHSNEKILWCFGYFSYVWHILACFALVGFSLPGIQLRADTTCIWVWCWDEYGCDKSTQEIVLMWIFYLIFKDELGYFVGHTYCKENNISTRGADSAVVYPKSRCFCCCNFQAHRKGSNSWDGTPGWDSRKPWLVSLSVYKTYWATDTHRGYKGEPRETSCPYYFPSVGLFIIFRDIIYIMS